MPLLPTVADPAQFDDLLGQSDLWKPALEAMSARHSLAGPFTKSRTGSTVVFLSEAHCIKLHPPFPGFVASHRREVVALGSTANRLPIATPELIAEGELEGWGYFVSTRLPGRAIDEVWDGFDTAARVRLATDLGRAIRALHEVPTKQMAEVCEPWSTFRPAQRQRCLIREREKGLSEENLAKMEEYLVRLDAVPEPAFRPALLHTEIGPSHVLVDGDRISGLIDFGDAMVGDPEYDLAPVGMFVTRGDAAAFSAFLRGYGLTTEELADRERQSRLLRHALLHRYATLAWYLEVLSVPSWGGLEDLARAWFGVDAG